MRIPPAFRHAAPAACLSLTLLIAAPGAALADLKPFQKAAVERVLETMPAAERQMARPLLEAQFASLSEAQITMVMAGLENAEAETAAMEEAPDQPVTEEDLAFNRAQYEPAVRKLFDAALAYDLLVSDAVAAGLPQTEYAVWGHGWRAELPPLRPTWQSAITDFDVFRLSFDSMAPQDGRYRFRLPEITARADEAAIRSAIAKAAQDYAAVGERFKAEARRLADAEKFDELYALERRAGAEVEPIRTRLEKLLAVQAPSGTALAVALQQGTPVN